MRNALAAIALATAVCGPVAAQETAYSDEARQVLRDEIRAYLLENPEVLMEAIGILEERKQQEADQAAVAALQENRTAIFDDGFSYVGGNPEGSVTVVEFLDYQCGYCKRAHADVQSLVNDDGDIRFIVKEFPILGPASIQASRATMAVLQNQGPEVYHAFHEALMTFDGRLNEDIIDSIAEASGADVPAMKAAMDSEEITQMLTATRALAEELQVTGTPTFVIGDEIVRGALPLADLRDVVAQERNGG